MGLKKWFARKGNIGGIARNVAEGWKNFEDHNPGTTPKEIATGYAAIRAGLIDDYSAEKIINEISSGLINTPLDLAWTILLLENINEYDVLRQNKEIWLEIMREEMEKKGLDPDLRL